jgi:hypothetical protein
MGLEWDQVPEDEKAETSKDMHQYISTACLHCRHDECRRSCKFCKSPCLCSCHVSEEEKRMQGLTNWGEV